MINTNKIITSKNITFKPNGLLIFTVNNMVAFCPSNEISDIPINVKKYFSKYANYKFYVYGKYENVLLVSYKKCHPNFILNKNKIYPTASHFHNLLRKINDDIDNY